MRFFNAQNHSSGYRNPIFLNITSSDCKTFEFCEEKVNDHGDISYEISTSYRFLRSHKDSCFINYAYAGGVNKCNYDRKKTFKDGKIYLTFTLAKAIHSSIPEFYGPWYNTTLWDFGHAVFKDGSPVITIELVFSITGELEYSIFTSLYNLNHDGNLIRFYSVSDKNIPDDSNRTTYYKPDQVTPSGDNTPISLDMLFSYQDPDTDINSRVVKGLRHNIDVGPYPGSQFITPICWFIDNSHDDYLALIMVLGSTEKAWDMNSPNKRISYCKWFSDDDNVSEYKDEVFPGYNGLDNPNK